MPPCDRGREHGRRVARPDLYLTLTFGVLLLEAVEDGLEAPLPSAPVQTASDRDRAGDVRAAVCRLPPPSCSRSTPLVAAAAPRRDHRQRRVRAPASATQRLVLMNLLLSAVVRRRSRDPVSGSKKCSARVSTATSTVSPSLDARARAEAADDRRLALRLPRRRRVGRAASSASSRTSSVCRRAARRSAKCTMISEPSASRSSTSPRRRAVRRCVAVERGVLEVLRPDAEHDRAGPRSRVSAGRAASSLVGEAQASARRPSRRGRRSRARASPRACSSPGCR